MRIPFLATIVALAVPVSAQVFRETFTYPNGPVPGWTQQAGSWQVLNGHLVATSGATWAYITKDGLSATRCVIDGEFFFAGSGIQFGGLTARHPGGPTNSNELMVKIQSNGSAAFDHTYEYEQPVALGTYFATIPTTVSAYCRMIVRDNEFWMETDGNKDGLYELVMPRRPITTVLLGTLVGMAGYSTSEMDNFKFFDAVLTPQPSALPRIGTTYSLDLLTPSPNAAWLGLAALGNTGFPIGSRAIPVDPDFLAIATFGNASFGLIGATDMAGNATMSLAIPAIPAIVGLRVYVSAITVDHTQPYGVGNISNEQAFVIQP
jgi:hypothetical protein